MVKDHVCCLSNGLLDRHTDGILAFGSTAIWILLRLESATTVCSWCSGSGLCGFFCIFLPCYFHGVRLLQEEEAVSALDAACTVPAWRALQESCGGNPEVIGLCKFDAQSNTITIAAL